MNEVTIARVRNFPPGPGVYLMKNSSGTVIYVGKAANLKARVLSYFQSSGDNRPSRPFLIDNVNEIEFIATLNEKEALLLENTLIKQYQPRYNVLLKDDKSFLSLIIDRNHDFPAITAMRTRETGDNQPPRRLFFGPYSSAKALRATLKNLQQIIPLRTCSDREFKRRTSPCLKYHIGKCSAPCVGLISLVNYGKFVDQAIMFLKGRNAELARVYKSAMENASEQLAFEEAAKYRDRISLLNKTLLRQDVFRRHGRNRDVVGYATQDETTIVCILRFAEGKLIEKRSYRVSNSPLPIEEIIEAVLYQHYAESVSLPAQIVVSIRLPNAKPISEVLSDRNPVELIDGAPQRLKAVLKIAAHNANQEFHLIEEDRNEKALQNIASRFKLVTAPVTMECFDISNLGSTGFVGSMTVFVSGRKKPSAYRTYRIQNCAEQNDVAMIAEVIERRIRRGIDEKNLPNLILVDGGKGQLNAAYNILKRYELTGVVGIAAIAKDRGGGTGERFFIPGRKNPITFHLSSLELKILVSLRDEAHRFALKYQRKIRKAANLGSGLETIKGIGPQLRKSILKHFPDLSNIHRSEDLASIKGLSERTKKELLEYIERKYR